MIWIFFKANSLEESCLFVFFLLLFLRFCGNFYRTALSIHYITVVQPSALTTQRGMNFCIHRKPDTRSLKPQCPSQKTKSSSLHAGYFTSCSETSRQWIVNLWLHSKTHFNAACMVTGRRCSWLTVRPPTEADWSFGLLPRLPHRPAQAESQKHRASPQQACSECRERGCSSFQTCPS